ncbi:MAG TPA: hypothetical protein PK880_09435 [Candidatus Competibacter sp.]|nr:hypothetical protein [Candidatus Competibacter sp.]
MKISNYMNSLHEKTFDSGSRRLDRLEKRRDRWDQAFDKLQQEAIDAGDSEKAQKIFEMSEMMEEKLDARLDRLEKKTGEFSWNRHLDNAFDKLQAKAYETKDTEMAESAFGLSQIVKGGEFDSTKQALLEKFLSDSATTAASKLGLSNIPSSEPGWNDFIQAAIQKSASATDSSSATSNKTSGNTESGNTTASNTGTNTSDSVSKSS